MDIEPEYTPNILRIYPAPRDIRGIFEPKPRIDCEYAEGGSGYISGIFQVYC